MLARGLAARGHTVRIFTGDPEATAAYAYDWEGLPVQAVPWRRGQPAHPVATFLAGFANPPVEQRFAELCAEFRPEIVHVQHLLGLSPRLPGLSRRLGARVIITLHDYWFRCSNTWLYRYSEQPCPGPGVGYHCGGCALHRLGHAPQPALMALAAPAFVLRTAWLRRVLLAADRVIAPSRLAASVFEAEPRLRGKLTVVPHGWAPVGHPIESRPPGVGPVRFVYLGPLIQPKGVHVIVQAFNALPTEGAELHLYGDLTADPAYVDKLRQLAAHPGLVFHGPVARERVPSLLAQADVLLVPTLLRETYSLVVDEAFAAGVPVLVAAGCAAAERVVEGVNGLLALAGDVPAWQAQLQRLATEPGLLARLRAGVTPPAAMSPHLETIERLYQAALKTSNAT